MLGALCVQDVLNSLILSRLERRDTDTAEELTSRDGPLYSFASAILLAYGMGLIEKEVKTRLDTIRRVRNAFAHAYRPVSFKTTSIADACHSLRKPRTAHPDGIDKGSAARHDYLAAVFSECGKMARSSEKHLGSEVRKLKRQLKKLDASLKKF